MEKLKIFLRMAVIVIAAAALLMLIFTSALAKTLSSPKGLSLEEEKEWAESHGVWGNLEDYDVEDYTVSGKDDYILHCELVANEETRSGNKYVIISHGYNSNRYGAAKYVPVYIELGYNCIIYDLRGHGENEKSVNTIGNFESEDLIKIINDTYDRYGEDIYLGLHGESMGSSTSLSALKFKPKVHFVVADCGFANLYELIGKNMKGVIRFAEPIVDLELQLFFSYSMKDTSAIDALSGNTVPICFIHGADDTFITPDNSSRMKDATSGYSELHLIDNAEHARSREVLGKEAYKSIVEEFLGKVYEEENN